MLSILLWPFKLLFGLLGAIWGLVWGLVGTVFGVVGGLIGILFSGAFIALLAVGVVALVRWLVRGARA